MAPSTPFASPEQLNALVDFMSAHQELARGQLRGAEDRARFKQLWSSLTNSLNSMGNCIKSIEQWQRVWADRKHLAKKAYQARLSASASGIGMTAPALSQLELKILAVMGEDLEDPDTETGIFKLEKKAESNAKKCKCDDSEDLVDGKDSSDLDGLPELDASVSNVPDEYIATPKSQRTRPLLSSLKKSQLRNLSHIGKSKIQNDLMVLNKNKMKIELEITKEKLEIAKRERYKLDLELLKLERELGIQQPSKFTTRFHSRTIRSNPTFQFIDPLEEDDEEMPRENGNLFKEEL